MTLEEAITYEERKAESLEETADFYHTDEGVYLHEETMHRKCAERCWQLVEWLKELKAYRETYPYGVDQFNGSDTPQTDCDTCRHYKLACELFSEVCKYEPTTQNSNLTFENRTMLDCYNCKRYKSDDACVECRYEPKADTPQTDDKDTNVLNKSQTDCAWK